MDRRDFSRRPPVRGGETLGRVCRGALLMVLLAASLSVRTACAALSFSPSGNTAQQTEFIETDVQLSGDSDFTWEAKIKPSAHIDGMAALLDAMTVRQKWFGEIGDQLRNSER